MKSRQMSGRFRPSGGCWQQKTRGRDATALQKGAGRVTRAKNASKRKKLHDPTRGKALVAGAVPPINS